MLQLAHVVGLLGLINLFVLGAARKYLFAHPVLQEKIIGALLTPLLIADVVHISITWWALGESRWHIWDWSGWLGITFLTGFSLPRSTTVFSVSSSNSSVSPQISVNFSRMSSPGFGFSSGWAWSMPKTARHAELSAPATHLRVAVSEQRIMKH